MNSRGPGPHDGGLPARDVNGAVPPAMTELSAWTECTASAKAFSIPRYRPARRGCCPRTGAAVDTRGWLVPELPIADAREVSTLPLYRSRCGLCERGELRGGWLVGPPRPAARSPTAERRRCRRSVAVPRCCGRGSARRSSVQLYAGSSGSEAAKVWEGSSPVRLPANRGPAERLSLRYRDLLRKLAAESGSEKANRVDHRGLEAAWRRAGAAPTAAPPARAAATTATRASHFTATGTFFTCDQRPRRRASSGRRPLAQNASGQHRHSRQRDQDQEENESGRSPRRSRSPQRSTARSPVKRASAVTDRQRASARASIGAVGRTVRVGGRDRRERRGGLVPRRSAAPYARSVRAESGCSLWRRQQQTRFPSATSRRTG